MMNLDIVVIADTQIHNNSPTEHLEALSRYIWEHKPSAVVHIGDHWDFPSLSKYTSPLEREGLRLINDLKAGEQALDKIFSYVDEKNKSGKKTKYKPEKFFLMGNHENRLNRLVKENPLLQGIVDLNDIISSRGWKISDMNDPLWLDEICFTHYLENPMSGRAVGGSIENKLNKFPHSFVHGHQQQFQMGRRQNLLGKPHFGVCAGSFYMQDEDYRGANNTEIRGFVHLKQFENRYYYCDHDVEFISLERLLGEY